MYRDRHDASVDDTDLESLHFEQSSEMEETLESTIDLSSTQNSVISSGVSVADTQVTMDLEGGEADEAPNLPEADESPDLPGTELGTELVEVQGGEVYTDKYTDYDLNRSRLREASLATVSEVASLQVDGVTAPVPSEYSAASNGHVAAVSEPQSDVETDLRSNTVANTLDERAMKLPSIGQFQTLSQQSIRMTHESTASEASTSCDSGESVAGVCGSVVIDDEVDHDSDVELEDADIDGEGITVASTIASMDNEEHIKLEEMHGDQNDTQVSREVIDAAVMYQQQIGKRVNRDETPSEVLRVERHADKPEPKRTRTGLREYHERRRPAYLDDYVVNAVQRKSRIKDQNGKYIRASSVKIPRNRREARRSKFAGFWDLAEADEITALKTKGVIVEISSDEVPNDAKLLTTGWVYALKSDHEGYVIRFKARIVAFGNYQRPGIDFCETFSPVARMSSFRMLVALAAALHLKLYGGDINTAYLNAMLAIRQYLRSIDGFPCAVDGHVYMVMKALYGLRQSGREWKS
ncbi:hypothetical protein PC128_g19813 [Phytophthora cactorum]|nr:hypothetical protein PC128_g19813 [Phytophthora cactorum]